MRSKVAIVGTGFLARTRARSASQRAVMLAVAGCD
jgi:hypothetical protein